MIILKAQKVAQVQMYQANLNSNMIILKVHNLSSTSNFLSQFKFQYDNT